MTPDQEALARQYIANEADVSTSTSLLRAAIATIDAARRPTEPTDEDRRVMADAGGIAVRDLPFGAAEASMNIRSRDEAQAASLLEAAEAWDESQPVATWVSTAAVSTWLRARAARARERF